MLLILWVSIIAPLQAKNILVLGDSLSAGYGIDVQKGWVSLLSTKLLKEGDFKVINISTSGDTTSNGLAKLNPALQKYRPDVLIIELGANDALRGLPIAQMKNNLEIIIKESHKSGAKILLLATLLPPNYGQKYLDQYSNTYLELSQLYKVALVPMFLDGVAGHENLIQKDGLHPNEEAQPIILNNVWPALKEILNLR